MDAAYSGTGYSGTAYSGTDEIFIPTDPMDDLQCDSCQ